jgi:hypothetical protein
MTDEVQPRVFRDCANRVIQMYHFVATIHDDFKFCLRVAQVTGFTDNKVQVQFEDGTQVLRSGIQLAIL